MKKYVLCFVLCMWASLGFAQWHQMPFPGNYKMACLYFLNENTGFAGGSDWWDSGSIFKTTDAGESWQPIIEGNFQPNKIVSQGDTIAIGAYAGEYYCGMILLSTDRGQTWDSLIFGGTHNIADLFFKAGQLFVIDIAGQLYWFRDGGVAIYTVSNDLLFGYTENSHGAFLNAQKNIYAFAHDTLTVIKTFDGFMNSGIIQHDDRLYATIFDGYVHAGISSSVDGITWTDDVTSWTGYMHSLDFLNGSIYAAGICWQNNQNYSVVWQKSQGTWKIIFSQPSVVPEYGFVCIYHTARRLYVVGENGLGFYLNLDTVSGVEPQENMLAKQFSLKQNYPNPFNPNTHIVFELPQNAFVSLRVYDIRGREVSVLVNEQKRAGEYSIMFDGSGLPSGTYFYRLQAGDYSETKKMILMK